MSIFQRRRAALSATMLGACLFGSANLAAAVYQPPSDEPTAEEVAIVEFMNRFRADPATETRLILEATDLPGFFWRGVDREMFKRETEALPAVGPVVIDLRLLLAARQHSHYMILHGIGHDQDPGKDGFTGRSPSDRVRAAGFPGSAAENAFRDAGNAWHSHAGFIIDFGPGGPGGMQNGRGHRMNMAGARHNVVGASAVPHSGRFSVTHNLSTLKGRFAGGVVYTDRNRNGIFDPGEERPGAVIATADGKAQVRNWASGGYTLPLPNNSAGTLVISLGDLRTTVTIPASDKNVHASWAVPPEEELAAADRLLAAIDAIPEDERNASRRRTALVALWMGCRGLGLDAPRQTRVEALTAEIGRELSSSQATVLTAISAGDRKAVSDAQRNGAREWRGTAAGTWFQEAEILAKASDGVRGYEASRDAGREINPKQVEQLRDSLQQARDLMGQADIREAMAALIARLPAKPAEAEGGRRRR